MENIQELRSQLAAHQSSAESLQRRIERLESNCRHSWGAPVYDPIEHPGYQEPASGAGSDYIPSFWVSARTDRRWHRTCTACGKKQTTSRTKMTTTSAGPELTGSAEVPDFGD